MTKNAADRLTLTVAAFGLVTSMGALLVAGPGAAMSTAAGAVLALINLLILRTIVFRVIEGDLHTKLPLVALIFVKMGLFTALVYLAISRGWVEPITFTAGFSSLPVGLITGSLFLTRTPDPKKEY